MKVRCRRERVIGSCARIAILLGRSVAILWGVAALSAIAASAADHAAFGTTTAVGPSAEARVGAYTVGAPDHVGPTGGIVAGLPARSGYARVRVALPAERSRCGGRFGSTAR
jgi:hypothetical protein